MKTSLKYISAIAFMLIFSVSCEDYLDFPPEATVLEEEVFGTYVNFQGYVDNIYQYIEDGNKSSITVGQQMGGETIAVQGWNSSRAAAEGNYLGLLTGRSIYKQFGNNNYGWWWGGWTAIRIANTAIQNIDLLNGTEAEKNYLLGQAHFFRALFHMEIWRGFGSIPYIDEVLTGSADKPRFFEVETEQYGVKKDCQAVAERIVADFDLAASYLPVVWPDSRTQWGRPTKGAALAMKARTLITAGSPLFNEFSGNGATFDVEYMQRAAEAAAEVINLGVYSLQNFAEYKDMFCRNDGTMPITDEIIFAVTEGAFGSGNVTGNGIGRLFLPHQALFGGNAITEAVTQNYVDKFEMSDGSEYDPDGDPSTPSPYDTDDSKRWNDRDPRFRGSIYVDGDRAGIADATILELYVDDGTGKPGKTRNNGNTLSPYIVHKYWSVGANQTDGLWNSFYFWTPLMRLADVYLMYAEAVYEGYGSQSASAPNSTLTAEQAVNLVRSRAGMPDAATTISRNDLYSNFRDLVRNERHVELCFEGHYWFDLRRWKVKPDPILYEMRFDKDYNFFSREVIIPFIFEDRHWWMPFPVDLTQTVDGFAQNPGWN